MVVVVVVVVPTPLPPTASTTADCCSIAMTIVEDIGTWGYQETLGELAVVIRSGDNNGRDSDNQHP